MKVYSYDYNGKYIGETEAELCQVTELKKATSKEVIESEYIIPAYSTEVAPPVCNPGEEIIFDGKKWTIEVIPVIEKPIEKAPEVKPEHIPDYKELRLFNYPSINDYLDGIVKNDQAQIQKYIDDCKAVKLKYPKV